MSSREARIERVVRIRDDRLKQAVRVLEEARALERKLDGESRAAVAAREQAEKARRDLTLGAADVRDFLEAEDWLRSLAVMEELCLGRLRQVRAQLDRALAGVKDARIKVRQLEQLKLRLEQARRAKQNRADRTLDDEIGQRAAQSLRRRR